MSEFYNVVVVFIYSMEISDDVRLNEWLKKRWGHYSIENGREMDHDNKTSTSLIVLFKEFHKSKERRYYFTVHFIPIP